MKQISNGFTLIELMVTLAVTAIVVSVAIPNFNTQILNNRSVALGEDFATALNYTRSEAVRRAARVSICASSDAQTCTGTWTDGFIVFIDHATTDTADQPKLVNPSPAPDEEATTILKVWKKQDARAQITVKSAGANMAFVRYNALGALARVTDETVVIESELKNCKGQAARKITVGISGMVSIEKKACTVY